MMNLADLPVQFLDDAMAEGREQGRVEGHAEVLLHILERRGFAVPDKRRAEVESCTDEKRLETWTDRALDASTLEDVFDSLEVRGAAL